MSSVVVTIVDSIELARSIDRYLRYQLESTIESYFMTYDKTVLTKTLFEHTDLFIFDLFRRDDLGYRAEGIFAAEQQARRGRRALIVSGTATAQDTVNVPFWDLAAQQPLFEKVQAVLSTPPPSPETYGVLRQIFKSYYRPAVDLHVLA